MNTRKLTPEQWRQVAEQAKFVQREYLKLFDLFNLGVTKKTGHVAVGVLYQFYDLKSELENEMYRDLGKEADTIPFYGDTHYAIVECKK